MSFLLFLFVHFLVEHKSSNESIEIPVLQPEILAHKKSSVRSKTKQFGSIEISKVCQAKVVRNRSLVHQRWNVEPEVEI